MVEAPGFLRLRVVRDAILVARPQLDDWTGGAGVLRRVDGELRYVKGTGIRRFGREQIVPPSSSGLEPGRRLDAAVFAGFLYDQYGHFLLESLARLWPPATSPGVPVVWIAAWAEELAPWMVVMLDLMAVGSQRVVVAWRTGPVEVGELLVPDPGFEFGRFMHPWIARRLASRPVDSDAARDHVWLSRSRRAPISGLDEEEQLDERLAEEGWLVLHPEDLTVSQQLDALAGAVHVGGLEGSALHTLALLRGFKGTVDLFTRQNHQNFEVVAGACGLNQVRHRIPGATPRERKKTRGTDVQWSGVDMDAIVALLRTACSRHGGHSPR